MGTNGNPNEFDHLTDRLFNKPNTNVGYEPGQVGYVPPVFAKLEFQRRQYDAMYLQRDIDAFEAHPISFMTIFLTPVLLVLIFATGLVGVYMIGGMWEVYWPGIPVAIAITVAVEYLWIHGGYRMWVTALALHRQNDGPLAPWLGESNPTQDQTWTPATPPAAPRAMTAAPATHPHSSRPPLTSLFKDKRVWIPMILVAYFVFVGGGYSVYHLVRESPTKFCQTVIRQ